MHAPDNAPTGEPVVYIYIYIPTRSKAPRDGACPNHRRLVLVAQHTQGA